MPRLSTYALQWSPERQLYELSANGLAEQDFGPDAEGAWLHWLEAHDSFAFQGREGRLSVIKEARPRGGSYWYSYRSHGRRTAKQYLGRAANVTFARLEEVAGTLAARSLAAHKQPIGPEPASLLLPKLLAPRLPALLVERPRLLELLDAGLERPLTLVVAPAGFGKTTLAANWLSKLRIENEELRNGPNTRGSQLSILNSQFTAAWVSLDENDNDLLRFWRYVITACQAFDGQIGRSALALLAAGLRPPFEPPPVETALTLFLNDLTGLAPGQLLVLDDYHAIAEQRIHETLAFFIEHLPPALRVVLLTRHVPPLPVLLWHARGNLHELNLADLRFSTGEAAAFLRPSLQAPLSDAALGQLDTYLEGWAAGLRLLALTLRGQPTQQAVEQYISSLGEHSGPSAHHRSILDYFVTEILHSQPEPMQLFLLQTSVLGRLSGSLCDAVTGGTDSGARLEAVQRAGLFLEPLDSAGQWYRYHSLFAEAMRGEASRRLGEGALQELSLRASSWYEQHGLLAEAIETALLARDLERAARLIEQADAAGRIQEPQTVHRWLEQLPEVVLHARPALCLIAAIMLRFASEGKDDPAAAETTQERIEALLQAAAQGWRDRGKLDWVGALDAFRALSALSYGAAAPALVYARQALTMLPKESPERRIKVWRGVCLFIVGLDSLSEGRLAESRELFLEAHACSLADDDRHFARGMLLLLGLNCFLQGELHMAQAYYRQVLPEAREQNHREDLMGALLGLSSLACEWNDLAAAEELAREAFELASGAGEELDERATAQLALVQYSRGHTTAALRQIAEMLARLQTSPNPLAFPLIPFLLVWRGRLLIETGDLQGAQQALETLANAEESLPLPVQLQKQILQVRLLLAQGKAHDAQLQLERLLPIAQERQHAQDALEIQVLLALAHAGKHEREAHEWLRRALAQASSAGYVRLFANEGEPLARLLRSLVPSIQEKALRSYAQAVLRAFTPWSDGSATGSPAYGVLSMQERRVLRLLAAGRTNAEIAEELIVSVNTVKDHVKHLYRKLNVSNRLQASAAARDLKLS